VLENRDAEVGSVKGDSFDSSPDRPDAGLEPRRAIGVLVLSRDQPLVRQDVGNPESKMIPLLKHGIGKSGFEMGPTGAKQVPQPSPVGYSIERLP